MAGVLAAIGTFFATNAPAITAGSALAGAGASIGSTIANAVGGSGGSSGTPAIAKPTGPTASQSATATQAGNNLIAQTGGGLSPEALTQLVGMLDTSGQSFGGAGQGAVLP